MFADDARAVHGKAIYALIEDKVAYDVFGAAFVTEDGSELGTFKRNIAIRCPGTGEDLEGREKAVDFGFSGHGFWFQGMGGIEAEDNVSAGSAGAAYVLFPCRCRTRGTPLEATFKTENLLDPAIAKGEPSIAPGSVPIRSFNLS